MKSSVFSFERQSQAFKPAPSYQVDHDEHQTESMPFPSIDHMFGGYSQTIPEETPGTRLDDDRSLEQFAALETMPHLLVKIQELWNTRDLNTFIARLFLDSRDGSRAGFPADIARELLFLSRFNLRIRAEAAAPLLGIRLAEAEEMLLRGDQMALGHASSADDVWAQHVAHTAGPAKNTIIKGTVDEVFAQKPRLPNTDSATPRLASPKLSGLIRDTPPLPPTVRIDITTPTALRSARGEADEGAIMDKGLFRCLTKELSGLQIGQLVLSSLGESSKCDWLPSGLRFVRMHCKFRKIVLHVDLLSAPEKLLRQYIKEGIGHLVIYLNLTSGKWRERAQKLAATDRDYFQREIQRLVEFRNEFEAAGGQRCALSVATTSRRGTHALGDLFPQLQEIPGLVKYHEVLLPPGINSLDAQARGSCHCLAPFIEAHVRTNGHLVACAQDHSGYSFTADLTRTNFAEAWLSKAYRMTRLRVARGEQAGRLCMICPHKHSM